MMGWLIALCAVAMIAVIPVGLRGVYNKDGARVWLLVGPVRFVLYPSVKEKEKKITASGEEFEAHKKQTAREGGSVTDFLPFLRIVLDLLGELKGRLRVSRLDMKLILADSDPCNLSVNYGRAWAVLGNLMPLIDNVFIVRKRNLEVECDYLAKETMIFARIDVVVTIGRFLCLAVKYGLRAIREYFKIINNRKGGAVT